MVWIWLFFQLMKQSGPSKACTWSRSARQAALAAALALTLGVSVGAPGGAGARAQEPDSTQTSSFRTVPEIRIVQPDPSEPAAAPEGHLVVQWEPVVEGEVLDVEPGAFRYELRLSSLKDGPDVPLDLQTLSVGDDRASFVSGLPGGPMQIRVRAVTRDGRTGPWSPPLRVEVNYPSRRTVALLMALGSLLLVATVVVIVTGHRRTVSASAQEGSPS